MSDAREVIHPRVDRLTVQAIDLLASRWNLTRQDTVTRLLNDAIGLHRDGIAEMLNEVRARWLEEGQDD